MSEPSTRSPRIIFINRFYWPEEPATAQLLTDLAEGLAARGHEVAVIARYPGTTALPRRETRRGVKIFRGRSTHWSELGLLGKAMDFATFFFSAVVRAFFLARRNDVLVALTDPPLLGIGVAAVAQARGARVFHWVQDIYPELAIELAGQRWLGALRPLRNAAWRRAAGGVTLSEDMRAVLAGAKVPSEKIAVIPNWAPAGLAAPALQEIDTLRAEWNLTGKFIVAYSGNLGRVHDLGSVLKVAEILRHEPEIIFVFIGGGAQRQALLDEVARRDLTNVVFHRAQSRAHLARTLALGDVHLVTLRPGCERYVFPSKLYGIASVGRPVVVIGPRASELARTVEDRGFGASFAPEQTGELANYLRALKSDREKRIRLGRAAAAWATGAGGAAAAVERWHALLAPTAGLAAVSPRA